MEEKEIMEGNKLIAEFMKMELETIYHEEGTDYNWTNSPKSLNWYSQSCPPFDCCWDWLMPVVEKIESLSYPEGYTVSINMNTCVVKKENFETNFVAERLVSTISYNKIESVFEAVIQFITWYNTNKQ